MSLFGKKIKKHDCWPPGGMVFEETWTCPDCGDKWTLVEKANHSEWVRNT
jgi:hypothetical protein